MTTTILADCGHETRILSTRPILARRIRKCATCCEKEMREQARKYRQERRDAARFKPLGLPLFAPS